MGDAANGWMEGFRGVVYPWDCDHLGHLNVKNYVGFFDQASFHLLSDLGFSFHDQDDSGVTLVDAQHTIRYLKEQRVGSLVKVESAVSKVGTKSVTIRHRMLNTETGDEAATSEVVAVCFDLNTRTSIPIPDDIRLRLERRLVSLED